MLSDFDRNYEKSEKKHLFPPLEIFVNFSSRVSKFRFTETDFSRISRSNIYFVLDFFAREGVNKPSGVHFTTYLSTQPT